MSDTISRQAAIDAFLTELTKRERKNLLHTWSTVEVKYFVMDMLEKLPSAESEPRWIPCSDENPKADGRYLITGKMGTVYSLDFEDGRWYGGIKPVAWMPLPEPYAERRTDD